jgi:hypothetical protein
LGNMAKRLFKFLKSKIFSFPCSGILYHPVFMSFAGLQAVIKEYIFTLFSACHLKIYTG